MATSATTNRFAHDAPAWTLPASRWDTIFAWTVLLIAALVWRTSFFGNPDFHVDEEFYALVADRMWHGALPYVDIWDRKPIGLFLIYAAVRPFSGESLIGVQIFALFCAWATAGTIWTMARRYVAPLLALFPAILYLFWLGVFGGFNAQSPVFYNLPMALAALLCLRAGDRGDRARIVRLGAGAMALVGIAIQIKYTAVFEGLFLGLWLIWLHLRAHRPAAAALGPAALWCGLALGPTLAVAAVYAMLGHWAAFADANFTSIFLRARLDEDYLFNLQAFILFAGLPLFIVSLVSLVGHLFLERPRHRDCAFLVGWFVAAMCGFTAIGNFYDHYALPLLPPLLVIAARIFGSRLSATALFIVLAGWAMKWWIPNPAAATVRSRATITRLADEAKPYLAHGPMFVWDGPSILYVATGAAPPTRFAYPDHLSNLVEKDALGIDTGAEMRRILALRPAVIFSSSRKIIPDYNPVTSRMIQSALARDYVEIDRQPEGWRYRDYILYVRRDLPKQHP